MILLFQGMIVRLCHLVQHDEASCCGRQVLVSDVAVVIFLKKLRGLCSLLVTARLAKSYYVGHNKYLLLPLFLTSKI